ncbi:hypothetical protein [Novosphingobium sp. BW1]|uniref:hypothetical protein n=1 Tax=Novosphingobium sp. BW1 TaxID=2592621 RepID=UPI0011DEEB41|nr:hypothetical protein [Novosphingobium sp. BW1]TYC89947.1 hypothetical protein FMM79_07835 [Novosphingobium sp. BW1]
MRLVSDRVAAALPALGSPIGTQRALAQAASGRKPNILVIWDDDIGWQNVSARWASRSSRTPAR